MGILQEDQIVAPTLDALARTSSYFLQGFFVGSILGLVGTTRRRKQYQVCGVRMAPPPVPYQTLATTVAKKGRCEVSQRVTLPRPEDVQNSMKRKLALVVSYVGSNYHGLQAQKDGKYKTVEAELAAALYSIGAILPTNDLQRIDWSRSSRTDKGVHAARIVISAKLEILADWLPKFPGTPAEVHEKQTEYLQQERTVRLKDLVTALNEKLPADIRAISCMKVNKSFTARDACTWREYEYILPAEILTVPCTRPANVPTEGPDVDYYSAHDPCLQDTELAVARLNDALQQFLGTQMFHNFNNMRKKEIDEIIERKLNPIKKKERKNARAHDEDSLNNVDIQDDEPLDEVEEEMQEIDAEVARVTAQEAASAAAERAEQKRLRAEAMPWSSYNATWAPVPVPIVDKFRIRIYMMQARLMRSADGQEMIAISVRGTGFLLNQIRLMVAAGILSARGLVPPETITAALQLPFKISFPMVPAEGLYLKYAGFGRNADKNYAMSAHSAVYPQEDVLLLDDAEMAFSEEFNRVCIQPKILADWHANDSHLMHDWLRLAEKFRPARGVAENWLSLLREEQVHDAETAPAEREKNLRHIESAMQDYKDNLQQWRDHVKSLERVPNPKEAKRAEEEGRAINIRRRHVPAPRLIKHNTLLPSKFATALVIRSGELPSLKVDLALRAIATQVATEQLPHDLSCDALLDLVLADGKTVDHWAFTQPIEGLIS